MSSWPTETPKFVWNKKSGCDIEYDNANRYLRIVSDAGITLDVIDIDDVVGAGIQIELNENQPASGDGPVREPTENLVDRQGSAVLSIYCYPRKVPSWSSRFGFSPRPNPKYQRPEVPKKTPRVRFHRHLTLAPAEDLSSARALVLAIQGLATNQSNSSSSSPKKYWVIVNPLSGPKKNAAQIAETLVIPMLEESGVECTLTLTTHSNHANEIMKDTDDILAYDGVVLMGGDGIIHEVLNGIRSRSDGDALLRERLPVGVVGCGTSNGLATSITHAAGESYGVVQDTFLIAKGMTFQADLADYQISNEETTNKYTSFLTFSWAFIAETDIDSEVLRFLGESRYDVWAVWLVLCLRSYRAKLSYTNNNDEPILDAEQPIPSSWTEMEAEFVLFWASQTSHAGKSNYHSPKSEFQDGVFQLFVIRRPISRLQLLWILLGLETGTHADLKGVEWIPCKQYRLVADDQSASYNDIDGELVEKGYVHGTVLNNAVNYFGRL